MKIERLNFIKVTIPLLVMLLIIFSFIMYGVMTNSHLLKVIDMASLEWFTKYFGHPPRIYEGDILNLYMTFCATVGDVSAVLKLTAILVIGLFIFKNKSQAVWVLLLMATGTWINYLIKQTVERQRPYSHLAIDSGWSFPSGHSNASTLLFLVIIITVIPVIKTKAIRIIITIIASILWISILFCRLYFHAHYFTDVIGGGTLAVIWVLLFIMAYPLFTLWNNKKN